MGSNFYMRVYLAQGVFTFGGSSRGVPTEGMVVEYQNKGTYSHGITHKEDNNQLHFLNWVLTEGYHLELTRCLEPHDD